MSAQHHDKLLDSNPRKGGVWSVGTVRKHYVQSSSLTLRRLMSTWLSWQLQHCLCGSPLEQSYNHEWFWPLLLIFSRLRDGIQLKPYYQTHYVWKNPNRWYLLERPTWQVQSSSLGRWRFGQFSFCLP